MLGELKIFKSGCTVVLKTTATTIATTTSTIHFFTVNPQIRVGQQISFSNYTDSATVSAVEHVSHTDNERRTKVTLSASTAISNNTEVTFTTLDNKFVTSGRVGETSTFIIEIDRALGRILNPNPVINFDDVLNINSYKVTSVDTFENTTELIKRVYTVTYKVGLKKLTKSDVINLNAKTTVDLTGTSGKIYGYELLTVPPGNASSLITNKKASRSKDLTNISFPSRRDINKKSETRLLIVYGDPAATFKLGVTSNTITLVHNTGSNTSYGANSTVTFTASAEAVNRVGTSTQQSSQNESMQITTIADNSSLGAKVRNVTGSVLKFCQTAVLAGNESIKLGHVLVAENTVKTIDSDGIYYIYLKFPQNNSNADITYTIKLSENVTDTFTGFGTSGIHTTDVVSLTTAQAVTPHISIQSVGVSQAFQSITVNTNNPISTGGGTVGTGLANEESVASTTTSA